MTTTRFLSSSVIAPLESTETVLRRHERTPRRRERWSDQAGTRRRCSRVRGARERGRAPALSARATDRGREWRRRGLRPGCVVLGVALDPRLRGRLLPRMDLPYRDQPRARPASLAEAASRAAARPARG